MIFGMQHVVMEMVLIIELTMVRSIRATMQNWFRGCKGISNRTTA